MPRKQRFKPSRKPKAVGTLTDLEPLDRPEDPSISTRDVEPDARGRYDVAGASPPTDASSESG